jgi:hypothetical protein
MLSLYINDAGKDRFNVIRMLTCEYDVSFADAKMIMCGVRTRILAGEYLKLQEVQARLEAMGAQTVIEIHAAGLEESI